MYILRSTVANPKPSVRTLVASLKKLVPGVDFDPVKMDAEDRMQFLLQAIEEDRSGELAARVKKLHAGDVEDASDKVVRTIIRERWGEELVYFDLTVDQIRGSLKAILSFVVENELRLFNDLTGVDEPLPRTSAKASSRRRS
ncbi:hypothetical protein AKJ09_01839 [Labilithrix luteola]|uniref:Uncharacterized protein n=1 Tax=Labilithrix luteola TaxID=1391654 RepID=A0A0K1PNQ2_9BACT|nr:hypothetical protein [Labilithrix luteola]AKU95175.1 hypothetical protein AKJ09_01839 [Labilithrix luteola]